MRENYHRYTKEQLEFIKKHAPNYSGKEFTKLFNEEFELNQSKRKVSEYRRKHGIHSKHSNMQQNEDGTFKKGNTSWNKGLKGYMGANRTSFKKGSKPPNWRPIGSERITKDGYIEVKIQDGKLQKNWRLKQLIIWEEANGKIPEGHALVFGDGNKTNFDLDNLILVSRKQLLGLNRDNLIQSDVELTKTAINIVDLKYKIAEKAGAKHEAIN